VEKEKIRANVHIIFIEFWYLVPGLNSDWTRILLISSRSSSPRGEKNSSRLKPLKISVRKKCEKKEMKQY
jgi:hypothetical protein